MSLKMKNNRIKTRERALEIPRIARAIHIIDHVVTVFFSRLAEIGPLLTHKGELRNQLFYVEQTLKSLPTLITNNIRDITTSIYKRNLH